MGGDGPPFSFWEFRVEPGLVDPDSGRKWSLTHTKEPFL